MKPWMTLLLLAISAPGCIKTAPACASTVECEEGLACVEEECRPVECLASEDCAINNFCDRSYKCVEGCESADDCLAGEECNSGECVSFGCRDTQLDCQYGEFCDTTTGECYQAEENYCKSCDVGASPTCSSDGIQGACFADLNGEDCVTDRDCPTGYRCDNFGAGVGFACHTDACALECNPRDESPCPRGFDCIDGQDGNFYCAGSCPWLLENGYSP